MRPKLYKKSAVPNDKKQRLHTVFKNIIRKVETFDCSHHFNSSEKLSRTELQQAILSYLGNEISSFTWASEYKPKAETRDAIDIFGSKDNLSIVIEIDAHRADQVAKKFVSRSALLSEQCFIYIALCYPGTQKMSKPECIKYFGYCSTIAEAMGKLFAGFMIESD